MRRSHRSPFALAVPALVAFALPACEAPPDEVESTSQEARLLPQTISPAGQNLYFRLSGPLKQDGCAGDSIDADCLADDQEAALARLINPLHFFDEAEDCPDRQIFWQVRPIGVSRKFQYGPHDQRYVASTEMNVDNWRPSGGTYYVQVTYFLNFRYDCNFFAGHWGDNEHITFLLASSDLVHWWLEQGHYPAHGFPSDGPRAGKGFFYSGLYLANIARSLGRNNPSLASDEDGHGSFPGYHAGTSSCAGADMYGLSGDGTLRDCFHDEGIWDDGHMGSAFVHGHYSQVLDSKSYGRNIGEPAAWNRSVLSVSADNSSAQFFMNGIGEPFSYAANTKFCGWNCANRTASGDCPGATCTTPMWDKVDDSCMIARGWYRGRCFTRAF